MISSIICQHCGKTFEAEITSKTELCTHCGSETAVNIPARNDHGPASVAGLRKHANFVVGVAIVAFILSGLVILITLFWANAASGETSRRYWSDGLGISGSLCSLSVGLYVIAQIIHIRANTLK